MSRRIARAVRSVALVITLAALAGTAPPALAACCSIIEANTQTGLVKAREGAAGRTFEFMVTDAGERKKLKAGQPVEANFDRNTAEVPPSPKRYQIANVSAARGGAAGEPGRLGGTPGRGAVPQPTIEAVVTNLVLVGSNPGVTGGQEGQAHVMLTGPAQAGPGSGAVVALASGNTTVLKVPPVVVVPAGERVGKFTFVTFAVGTPTQVTITATLADSSKTGTVGVVPARLLRFEIPTASIRGGAPVEGRVVLTGPPATAALGKVSLKSANPALVKVLDSVTVESGATQAAFKVETFGVAKDTPVVVSAYQSGNQAGQKTDTLTLLPPVLKSMTARGCPGPCTGSIFIRIEGKMPAEGLTIKLTSSHPNLAPVSPTLSAGYQTAANPEGQSFTGSFSAPVVEHDTVVTMTASLFGVTKKDDAKILRRAKPDLFIRSEMRLLDRFGNEVPQPPDAQPFRMCARIGNRGDDDRGGHATPASALKVTYRHSTNSSVSRTVFVPVPGYSIGSGTGWGYYGDERNVITKEMCFDLPGIQDNTHLDVELEADGRKEVDETSESNNDRRFRVERK